MKRFPRNGLMGLPGGRRSRFGKVAVMTLCALLAITLLCRVGKSSRKDDEDRLNLVDLPSPDAVKRNLALGMPLPKVVEWVNKAEWINLSALLLRGAESNESSAVASAKDRYDDFDLPDPDSYNFTSDWFSGNIRNWNRTLGHLRDQPDVMGLEIGSYEGRSAIWTLTHILTHPSSKLISCDYFASSYFGRYLDNTRAFRRRGRLVPLKGSTLTTLCDPRVTSGRYDVIVVDASHATKMVLLDTVRTWPLLKRGGVMIFDDYLWEEKNGDVPKPAIDGFIDWFEDELEVLIKGYQVLVKKVGGEERQ